MNQKTTLLLLFALTSSIIAVVAVAPIVNQIAYANAASQIQGKRNAGLNNQVQGDHNGHH